MRMVSQPRFPWSRLPGEGDFSLWPGKKDRAVIEFYLDTPWLSLCAWFARRDSPWNLFKSGRKNPLDIGDRTRVQLVSTRDGKDNADVGGPLRDASLHLDATFGRY